MLRRGAANDDSLCIEVSAHLFGTDTKRPRTPRGQEEKLNLITGESPEYSEARREEEPLLRST
jgi:hypothetical protein